MLHNYGCMRIRRIIYSSRLPGILHEKYSVHNKATIINLNAIIRTSLIYLANFLSAISTFQPQLAEALRYFSKKAARSEQATRGDREVRCLICLHAPLSTNYCLPFSLPAHTYRCSYCLLPWYVYTRERSNQNQTWSGKTKGWIWGGNIGG